MAVRDGATAAVIMRGGHRETQGQTVSDGLQRCATVQVAWCRRRADVFSRSGQCSRAFADRWLSVLPPILPSGHFRESLNAIVAPLNVENSTRYFFISGLVLMSEENGDVCPGIRGR